MKPPAIGSIVEWHQDLSYYPLTNGDSLAVLIYLDDTTIDNGCLQVIPGVHEQPLMDHTKNGYLPTAHNEICRRDERRAD